MLDEKSRSRKIDELSFQRQGPEKAEQGEKPQAQQQRDAIRGKGRNHTHGPHEPKIADSGKGQFERLKAHRASSMKKQWCPDEDSAKHQKRRLQKKR